ncbi:MAG: hypothetical protein RL211_1768 [Pseudomonadota bacterium]
MKIPLTRPEVGLLLTLALTVLSACLGPAVVQHVHYHAFADQRAWGGLPYAMDVLSNVPFAMGGIWGLLTLQRQYVGPGTKWQQSLAALFFAGLIITALCSGYYHGRPDNASLLVDRLGMVVAFAGLLGLAAVDRVSARAGMATAGVVLLLGSLAVKVWAASGNLLPWVVLQVGGLLLMLLLARWKAVPGAWGIHLGAVVVVYAVAKLLELGDHLMFDVTAELVSGHSLKHVVAALVAWPVVVAMRQSEAVHNVA